MFLRLDLLHPGCQSNMTTIATIDRLMELFAHLLFMLPAIFNSRLYVLQIHFFAEAPNLF